MRIFSFSGLHIDATKLSIGEGFEKLFKGSGQNLAELI